MVHIQLGVHVPPFNKPPSGSVYKNKNLQQQLINTECRGLNLVTDICNTNYKNQVQSYKHKAFIYNTRVKTMACGHNCTSYKRNYVTLQSTS